MEQPTRSLSPQKILDVWETGRQQHELDRALTLLAAAHPELSRDELADLTIGERDARSCCDSEYSCSEDLRLEPPNVHNVGNSVEFSLDTHTLADAGELAEHGARN